LVVVPGGAGYAGGRIVEHLAAQGWRVRVTSRSRTVWPGAAGNDVEVVRLVPEAEVEARSDLLQGATAVVMLAGADEAASRANPVSAVRATSEQCMAWLQAARHARVDPFVYFSTVHVYGPPSDRRLDEDATPRPIGPYAATHLAAEAFVEAATRAGWVKGLVFRLSNSFGAPAWPGTDQWGRLLNDLARQAVLRRQLVLQTDGRQARDFIPLSEVCRAVAWSLGRSPATDGPEMYNLGSGRSTSVLEMAARLASRCEAVLGFRPAIAHAPDRERVTDGTFRLRTDRLIRAGFAPGGDWDGELDGLLAFCRDHAPALAAT
jgi:UDP-glucose 4-epimerase